MSAIGLLLTRRRATPYLDLDPAEHPPIQDAIELLSGVTQSAHYDGNAAGILQNGAVYPAMLEDIRTAHSSVHLETFVWTTGDLERCFVDALGRAAQSGIEVRVLIDALGGLHADPNALERLRQADAEVSIYCRPRWWNWLRFNHRTHRKLLIVDGRIGYVPSGFGPEADSRSLNRVREARPVDFNFLGPGARLHQASSVRI